MMFFLREIKIQNIRTDVQVAGGMQMLDSYAQVHACVMVAVNQHQHAHAARAAHVTCPMLFLVLNLMNQHHMLPQSMKVCMEGANTTELLFDECILFMAGVRRQIVTTEPSAHDSAQCP